MLKPIYAIRLGLSLPCGCFAPNPRTPPTALPPRALTWRQVMNALEMEFPDNSFDLVWACESGEHMPDKKAYVDEMVRVLKPGGTLVIATWCQREETPEAPFRCGPRRHQGAGSVLVWWLAGVRGA